MATAAAWPTATTVGGDPVEARAVERAIALVRTLLAVLVLAVVQIDPPDPSRYLWLTHVFLGAYVVYSTAVLLVLTQARTIPRLMPLLFQIIDVGVGALLSLASGPNSPLFTFLLYPLLAAAYRWGFREVVLTAIFVDVMLAAEAVLLITGVVTGTPVLRAVLGEMELNRFLMRLTYVLALGLTMGYLAENEKRRRFEARALSRVLAEARLGGKLGDTIAAVLRAVAEVFAAENALLVIQERRTGRTFLWQMSGAQERSGHAEEVEEDERHLYFFPAPPVAWHAATAPFRRAGQFSVVAVNEEGQRVDASTIEIPETVLASHPCRKLIGVSLFLSDEWEARMYVLTPKWRTRRDQSARFALQLGRDLAPVLYAQYRVRYLRTRAQAVERGRIARELHDGVTQSLLGLEMEVVVLHRHALDQAPQLADDLVRVHRIVRNEIVAVRELMEGVRVGDEITDLLRHLSDVVERFGRYTGIAARFSSSGDAVMLSPHVRREIARIVHEALVNVRKHSGARRVLVHVDVVGASWKLTVEDDGRGFSFAGRRSQSELDATRQGPITIAERVRNIGGNMVVESRPGQGAKVEVAMDLRVAS